MKISERQLLRRNEIQFKEDILILRQHYEILKSEIIEIDNYEIIEIIENSIDVKRYHRNMFK